MSDRHGQSQSSKKLTRLTHPGGKGFTINPKGLGFEFRV